MDNIKVRSLEWFDRQIKKCFKMVKRLTKEKHGLENIEMKTHVIKEEIEKIKNLIKVLLENIKTFESQKQIRADEVKRNMRYMEENPDISLKELKELLINLEENVLDGLMLSKKTQNRIKDIKRKIKRKEKINDVKQSEQVNESIK